MVVHGLLQDVAKLCRACRVCVTLPVGYSGLVMKLHARAPLKLTPRDELAFLVEERWMALAAAERYRVMPDIASTWVRRFREQGVLS